jgi:2-polyprenyl-6-methoxyphenol hydroxylase-like FAD-dependent oxidoreductase
MAPIRGSTVGIIGGSIAGCAAAVALGRLGCDVHVFERSSVALRDRGAGIMVPPAIRDELSDNGYLPNGYPNYQLATRSWIVADGTPSGRRLWRQTSSVVANNWGILWRSLRAGVPGD